MGSESSFGKAVFSVVDVLAGSIEAIINAPEEIVADLFETIGNIIEDVLAWLSNQVNKIPTVGKFVAIVLNWLGSLISGTMNLAGAIIKGACAIISGIICGLIRLLGGLVSISRPLIVKGFFQIASGIGGAVIITAGKLVLMLQSIIFVQAKERKLTLMERQVLKSVFKNSLAIYNIRLIPGKAGVFDVNDRPFTMGNTIYIRNRNTANEPELLVHECTHVWQYQNLGARYISEALGAQWFIKDAYDWEAEIQRGNTEWVNFNRESQAEFLEDIYYDAESIEGSSLTRGNGAFYDADGKNADRKFVFGCDDQTARADIAVDKVRSNMNFRLSRFIFP